MTEFAFFFNEERVVGFVLLFVRLSAFFVFLPFFSSATVYPTVKAALAFFLALAFYPLLPPLAFVPTAQTVLLAVLTEALFGFAVGFVVQLVFAALQFAGEQISFVMGFSMASSMDPISQTSSPIISQFLYFFAILIFLAIDGHHLLLMFAARSLETLPLGTFLLGGNYLEYVLAGFGWMFVLGFMIAFPIIALSILSDIVFGMIMKTVPSFNLLVIGFPAKIFVAFMVMIAVMASIAFLFKQEFMKAFNALGTIFY